MDNTDSKNIKINEFITDSLTNENYRHIYDVYLDKNKYYFITLISKDDNEFNLRIYNDEKNIIKSKYDDKDENIYLADLNNNLEEDDDDYDNEDDEDEDEDDDDDDEDDDEFEYAHEDDDDDYEEDEKNSLINLNETDMINNLILDILKSKNPPIDGIDGIDDIDNNEDDNKMNDPNKIEIIIEIKENSDEFNLPDEDDLEAILKNNEISNNVIINFNNKIYFTPEKSGKYYLAVSSDYNYQIGEYSLNVQEVEDIKVTFNNKINLNDKINFKSKDKFKPRKYYLNLKKNKKYKIEGSENLKFFVIKGDQKIISKDNVISFIAKYNGKYEIEVMTLKKDLKCNFIIFEIENEETEENEENEENEEKDNKEESKYLSCDYDDIDNFDHKFNFDILNDNNEDKNIDIIKGKKIVLTDENNKEWELYIKNNKLEIKPFKIYN